MRTTNFDHFFFIKMPFDNKKTKNDTTLEGFLCFFVFFFVFLAGNVSGVGRGKGGGPDSEGGS
jgi:hypothetical protein